MRGVGLTPTIRIYPVKPCVPCGKNIARIITVVYPKFWIFSAALCVKAFDDLYVNRDLPGIASHSVGSQ